MFVINPPYTLHDELLAVMPYLVEVLGQYDGYRDIAGVAPGP